MVLAYELWLSSFCWRSSCASNFTWVWNLPWFEPQLYYCWFQLQLYYWFQLYSRKRYAITYLTLPNMLKFIRKIPLTKLTLIGMQKEPNKLDWSWPRTNLIIQTHCFDPFQSFFLFFSFEISASPTLQAAPRPIIMGMGFGNSASMTLRTGGNLTVVMMAMVVACLLKDVLFSIWLQHSIIMHGYYIGVLRYFMYY